MTADKTAAWLEYARLNPNDFDGYRGGCECVGCRQYRKGFDEWFATQANAEHPVECFCVTCLGGQS